MIGDIDDEYEEYDENELMDDGYPVGEEASFADQLIRSFGSL